MKTSNKLLTGFLGLVLLSIGLCLSGLFSQLKNEMLVGNGISITKEIPVSSLKKIHLSGHFNVFLVQGNSPSLRIRSDENILPMISSTMEEEELHIVLQGKVSQNTSIDIFITADSLQRIEMEAGLHLETPNGLRGPRLKIKSSAGAYGTIQLAYDDFICESSAGSELLLLGTATHAFFEFSAGSSIDALQLKTQRAKVNGFSGGAAELNVVEELTADVSSGASLEYIGSPSVENVNATSGGMIQKKSGQ